MSKLEDLIQKLCPNGVEWKELNEVFYFKNGYTPSKSNKDYWKNGTIPWFRMDDIRQNGRILYDSIQHVTKQAIKGSIFPKNSIILSTTATIGEHALIPAEFIANQQFTILYLREHYLQSINMKFMHYYFFIIAEWCKKNIKISSFPSVDMEKLRKFKIPIPPLEIQEEIVHILDSFTELTNELTNELTARRKQYEYYRDKLLTFKDISENK